MNVEQARRDVEQARRAYVLEPNSYTYWALVESLKRAAIKEAESQRPARRIVEPRRNRPHAHRLGEKQSHRRCVDGGQAVSVSRKGWEQRGFGKERHQGYGALAEFSMLNPCHGLAAIFTNGRHAESEDRYAPP